MHNIKRDGEYGGSEINEYEIHTLKNKNHNMRTEKLSRDNLKQNKT